MTEWASVAQFKALQARVAKEEERRAAADAGLGVQIGAEEGKRYAGDGVLTARIADLESTVNTIELAVAELGREPQPEPTPEPTPAPTPESTPDIFNGVKISDFPGKIQAEAGRIHEVPDPLGSGKTVIAMTVADGDVAPKGNEPTENPRSQLESPSVITPDSETWSRTRILFPADFPQFNGWMTLFSIYGPPYAGSGPVHISSYGKTLEWEEHGWSTPLVRGKWIDLMWHMKFAKEGWAEVWLDGQQVYKQNTETMNRTNNGGNNNVRIAQYRQKGIIPGTATVYFDGLKIGTTRASVGG
ncbi:MAG TPA: heparin lyase I family protein [Isosphaeraceae bacterium]|nr:heparin lyase I family protein [Isosphaeraceae bacterium]